MQRSVGVRLVQGVFQEIANQFNFLWFTICCLWRRVQESHQNRYLAYAVSSRKYNFGRNPKQYNGHIILLMIVPLNQRVTLHGKADALGVHQKNCK